MPNQAPEACLTCGAEPRLRKQCKVCGEIEWVITHTGEQYMGGAREVVECLCRRPGTKEAKATWRRKKLGKAGKVAEKIAGKRRQETKPRPSYNAVTTPEMARKAADGLARGLSVKRALEEAGYPPSTCRSGWRRVNLSIQAEPRKLANRYIKMGRELTAENQQNAIRGRLYEDVINGTDKGVPSAKQLGADKRISMWQPDSQTGLIVLQAPKFPPLPKDVKLLPPCYCDMCDGQMVTGSTGRRGGRRW